MKITHKSLPSHLMLTLACIAVLSACKGKEADTRTHYNNPFAESEKWYVNPKWAEQAKANGGEAIANESSAIWLNRIADIKPYNDQEPRNGMGLREHLDAAIEQQADLFTFVMYNLPGKGCTALYGSITPTERVDFYDNDASQANMDIYKKDYIGEIVEILSDEKYAGISIIAIIEPDSLINLAENTHEQKCIYAANDKAWGHTEGVRYVLTQFSTLKNIHSYIDVGNASNVVFGSELRFTTLFMKGVLTGFDGLAAQAQAIGDEIEAADGATGRFHEIGNSFVKSAGETPAPGWDAINGFITNTANYVPLDEPYLPDSSSYLEGDPFNPIRSSSFYDWNPIFGELEHSRKWLTAMQSLGADKTMGMLIDTSRNGWGGPNRPTPLPDAVFTTPYELVEALKIDRREHRRNFCNQEGAGIGERPQASPTSYIDAYIWAKPIGESDGIETGFDPRDINLRHETICMSDKESRFAWESYATEDLGLGTGAMKGAPHYGEWFSYAFKQLLENAYPPIGKELE